MKAPKFKARKRQPKVLSKESLVSRRHFVEGQMPLVIESKAEHLNLPLWIAENRSELRAQLVREGALLFRGFSIETIDRFQACIEAFSGELLRYTERSSPRHAVKGNVYVSTVYPKEEEIFLHNEQSYNTSWVRLICFFCETEPGKAGQTPIGDTRKILAKLDPAIRERFRKEGYIYRRNFGDGFGLTWQVAFQTKEKSEVETYCRENLIHFKWREGDRLTTWQRRPAIRRHPVTGEDVWFNHCTFFHVSTLPKSIGESLISEFDELDLPNQTFHGDGSSIRPETMSHLQKLYREEKVLFDWKKNDILILDNMLGVHGRQPFEGDRNILVAMSEGTSNADEDFPYPETIKPMN